MDASQPAAGAGVPRAAHPFLVYLDASSGLPYLAPGVVRCTATTPAASVRCPMTYLPWRPALPGRVWLAVTTGKDGTPSAVSASAGASLPSDTPHAPDRRNHDGTTTAGRAGLYHVEVAGFQGGPGSPIRQILRDDIAWAAPAAPPDAGRAALEYTQLVDTLGRTVTLAIQDGLVAAAETRADPWDPSRAAIGDLVKTTVLMHKDAVAEWFEVAVETPDCLEASADGAFTHPDAPAMPMRLQHSYDLVHWTASGWIPSPDNADEALPDDMVRRYYRWSRAPQDLEGVTG